MKCPVVDDSAITRRILVSSLGTIGFDHVVEATDGKSALHLCDDGIDIVITDWNMPGMGGVELARNVREDVVEAAQAGVDGYMVKPFTPETLRARIEELFHARAEAKPNGTDG